MIKKIIKKERFLPESAGSLMTDKVPLVEAGESIKKIEDFLSKRADYFETINYIYVVDKKKKLKGVFSIKEFFQTSKDKKAADVIKTGLVSVRPHTDQEKVALLAIKHNLKSIPVVDKRGRFLGVVPSDVILKILNVESIEDALRFAGVSEFDQSALKIIKASAFVHFKKRVPWLVLGLLGGIVAAFIVGFFEEALRVELLLAAFIPAVVYMADAVGSQTQIIFIRSLALGLKINLKKYIFREIKVTFSLALFLGFLVSIISFLWLDSFLIGSILAFSIFFTILVAAAVAIFLPCFFLKLKYDPAIASGPFATVVRDILSLLIYFSIAQTMISFFN